MPESFNGLRDGRSPLAELTDKQRHDLLASTRRRLVIDILRDGSAPINLTELAAETVRREQDRMGAVEQEQIDRIAVELHHSHLPKMDDMGVLVYDSDASRVERSNLY